MANLRPSLGIKGLVMTTKNYSSCVIVCAEREVSVLDAIRPKGRIGALSQLSLDGNKAEELLALLPAETEECTDG